MRQLLISAALFLTCSLWGDLSEGFNRTGMFLYYLMERNENTVISPLAINASLLTTYVGAKGTTATEIKKGLNLTLSQEEAGPAYQALVGKLMQGAQKLRVGNSLWVPVGTNVLSSYKSVIKKDFEGEIRNINFERPGAAVGEINQWVYDRSYQKIAHFLSPSEIPRSAKMLLLNSLFIVGNWESPFPTQNTGSRPFQTAGGETIQCPMMKQIAPLYYFEDEKSQIVALPLENINARLAFVLFLPKEKGELYNFFYAQDEKAPEDFLAYLNKLQKRSIELTLPKFIISHKLNLTPLLQTLGIRDALTKEADFLGIDGKKDLRISKAFHESVLSIDEGGIFATAAPSSAFSLEKEAADLSVEVNRPFLYAIYDFDSKLLLTLGECLNPTQTGIMEVLKKP
ncbi:serpin family protein [Candidatus Neptunochlamydia vexilliferae]|uniref:Serpin domain-containing protein n=1 Tax=Candidatus Neptunichlamydia vexilliferae TaxID=1651774 RepID=A0ABS0AWW9_9BACT|nr:serpin family protein [Candidatus Neptunochlamydia vexilliferae]MBF5058632.1 hypothetical protein [Candidatus Neptunochlamydia vexilliferae]